MTPAPDKFPRIPHLPWSPGGTRDDRRMSDVDFATLAKGPLIVTEKLDGSNVCLTRAAVYARSHAGPPAHPSFDALKARHAQLRHLIRPGDAIFCEWTWAVHSIQYDSLPTDLWLLAVLRGDVWMSWDSTLDVGCAIGVRPAPILARLPDPDAKTIRAALDALATPIGLYGPREGFVVRREAGCYADQFAARTAKWVRRGHVQTDEHWTAKAIIRQRIAKEDP